jgi:hypothetical protein
MNEFDAFDDSNAINEEEYYFETTMMETNAFIKRYGCDLFVSELDDSVKDDLYHALAKERGI